MCSCKVPRPLAFPLLCSNSGLAPSTNSERKLVEAILSSNFGHVKLIANTYCAAFLGLILTKSYTICYC